MLSSQLVPQRLAKWWRVNKYFEYTTWLVWFHPPEGFDRRSPSVDLPSVIKCYQDVLQYDGSKVDFVFGIGFYMAPSNMLLCIGNVADYNNEIIVATDNQKLV